jgi:hypothetical protein
MIESKAQLTRRLTAEGRWDEAEQFKNSKIRELRADGLLRPEAQTEAWAAMAEEYPPIPIPEEEPEFTSEEIVGLPSGTLKEFAADAGWVYTNLELRNADTENAPSTGALALLSWARAHKDDFFSKIVPRVLQLQDKQPAKDAQKEAAEAEHERIDDLLERAGEFVAGSGWKEERDAFEELREAKGFQGDALGYAEYLRGLIDAA